MGFPKTRRRRSSLAPSLLATAALVVGAGCGGYVRSGSPAPAPVPALPAQDVDGDGVADIVVGAPAGGSGEVLVFRGRPDLRSLSAGEADVRLSAEETGGGP